MLPQSDLVSMQCTVLHPQRPLASHAGMGKGPPRPASPAEKNFPERRTSRDSPGTSMQRRSFRRGVAGKPHVGDAHSASRRRAVAR
jgi:hypothetical protein